MKALNYASIRASSTDHPQVFMTAKSTFDTNANTIDTPAEKKLVLITDGETHNGKNCKKGDHAKYETEVGKCDTQCNRTAGACDLETMNNVCLLAQGKGGATF